MFKSNVIIHIIMFRNKREKQNFIRINEKEN